jgi:hypothetical protein
MSKIDEEIDEIAEALEKAGHPGLWANIHAKRERIEHGSKERMRSPKSPNAPSKQDFINSQSKKVEKADEGTNNEMAESDVNNIEDKAEYLNQLMQEMHESEDAPAWMIEKIGEAKTHIQDVMDYVKGQKDHMEKSGKIGEGSRGGKIVGHSKSGEPIYESAKKEIPKIGAAKNAFPSKEDMKKIEPHMHGRAAEDHDFSAHHAIEAHDADAAAKHMAMSRAHFAHASERYSDADKAELHQHAENGGAEHVKKQAKMLVAEAKHGRNSPEHKAAELDFHDHVAGLGNGPSSKMSREKAKHMRAEAKEKKPMKKSIDTLLETVRAMGSEALKKAIPNLTESQKELLKEALAKAYKEPVSMDAEQPKDGQELIELDSVKGKAKDRGRHNQEDEKMVKEEADDIKHQGDNEPEGFEGQVIKAMPEAMMKEEHKMEPKMEMKDANPMELAERMKARGMKKEDAMAKLKERGHHDIAAELDKCWDMKKSMEMNPAEEAEHQEEMKDKKEAKKKNSEIKMEAKKEEKAAMPKMEKSVQWSEGTSKLLKVSTRRGQNAHYSVEDYLLKSETETQEKLKKGQYLNEEGQPLIKSVQKVDINDLIEKGMDYSQDQVERLQGLAKTSKTGAFTVSSFTDEDMAKAMPMAVEPMGHKMPGATDESEHIGRTGSNKPVSKDSFMRSEDYDDEDHKDAAKLHKACADDCHEKMRKCDMGHERMELEKSRDHHDLSAEYHDCKACGMHDKAEGIKQELHKCWMM